MLSSLSKHQHCVIAVNEEEMVVEAAELLVRQSYPYKTSGQHEVEQLRSLAMHESHRILTAQGQVIKFMQNGTITVSPISLVSIQKALQ